MKINAPLPFRALKTHSLLLIGGAWLLCSALATQAQTPALNLAHQTLWTHFVDRHGIINDFVGDTPTPEDCALGRPNAIGWWSPIENGPMFTGLYLPAACERARRTGDPEDRSHARTLAQGLLKCASVSKVPGFIARGIGTDSQCHYPMGSDDQTHPWFYGLHAYLKTDIPSPEERALIVSKMKTVADVLESNDWRCPCDEAFQGQFRGGYKGHLFRDAVRYLFMLRAMHEVTGEDVWLGRYHKARAEVPTGGSRPRSEICAEGYPHDREAILHIDDFQIWIYVGSQGSLAELVRMEKDQPLNASYRRGLELNAKSAQPQIGKFRDFDNNDQSVFGNADWRAVYHTWFPQKSQEEARKLSETGDKAKAGGRKYYEARLMKNPLAAATIVALAGGDSARDVIEQAINHYDYTKLHMAEMFFAECAYYALPERK